MLPPFQEVGEAADKLAECFVGVAVASVPVTDDEGCASTTGARLTQRERALWSELRCARRRAEFLAGRMAARRAVAHLLNWPAPGPIEILKDAGGAPFVVEPPALEVSISHSNGVALAVAALVPVGVDLETDDARPAAFASLFFSASERRTLSAVSGHVQQTLLNTLWTRKEAVSKVGRWGGTLAFARVDCLDSTVRVAGCPIAVRSTAAAGYVLSIAIEQREAFAHG